MGVDGEGQVCAEPSAKAKDFLTVSQMQDNVAVLFFSIGFYQVPLAGYEFTIQSEWLGLRSFIL
jgi:hypothetical protein